LLQQFYYYSNNQSKKQQQQPKQKQQWYSGCDEEKKRRDSRLIFSLVKKKKTMMKMMMSMISILSFDRYCQCCGYCCRCQEEAPAPLPSKKWSHVVVVAAAFLDGDHHEQEASRTLHDAEETQS
jgi:hypothetical protein